VFGNFGIIKRKTATGEDRRTREQHRTRCNIMKADYILVTHQRKERECGESQPRFKCSEGRQQRKKKRNRRVQGDIEIKTVTPLGSKKKTSNEQNDTPSSKGEGLSAERLGKFLRREGGEFLKLWTLNPAPGRNPVKKRTGLSSNRLGVVREPLSPNREKGCGPQSRAEEDYPQATRRCTLRPAGKLDIEHRMRKATRRR